jgi:hypothetical protein
MEGCQVGCAGNCTFLCIHEEFCCKSGTDKLCCICCALKFESPSTCCKAEEQCCCLIAGSAFPPDPNEVPCMLASCCLMCYPLMGCMKTIAEVKAK